MSLHTNFSWPERSSPSIRKNRKKVLTVRSWPIPNSRFEPASIWYTSVRYLCPFCHCTSSTPIDSTPSRSRCAKPQETACFTEQNTFCHVACEGHGNAFPREPPSPASQEPTIGCRQLVLAVAPGNLLHLHTTPWTLDAPHRVHEEHRDLPERHRAPPAGWSEPSLGQSVVAGSRLAAARADCPAIRTWLDRNLDRRLGCGIDPACFLVNERLVPLDVIEDSFQLHGCGLLRRDGVLQQHP